MKIIEKALHALPNDQLPQNRDRQVSLANAGCPDKEQPEIGRVFLHEFLREELGRLQAAIGQSGLPVFANVEVFEGAILVPRLDARPQQPPLSAVCRLAVAWRHAADAIRLDGLPARALTLGALRLAIFKR